MSLIVILMISELENIFRAFFKINLSKSLIISRLSLVFNKNKMSKNGSFQSFNHYLVSLKSIPQTQNP
jgi:hypothetical protein